MMLYAVETSMTLLRRRLQDACLCCEPLLGSIGKLPCLECHSLVDILNGDLSNGEELGTNYTNSHDQNLRAYGRSPRHRQEGENDACVGGVDMYSDDQARGGEV